MDKNRKLRRYNRKDYTQLVDFPVEIVGRDGVVRRYSFEESVRLYQRRIASASSRYPDTDIAVAEMRHCRLRIKQLRRSYFARYGWTALEGARDGVGAYAGEVAAFLRRCLAGIDVDPEGYALSSVTPDGGEADQRQVFYAYPRLTQPGLDTSASSYLLYFYAFPEEGESIEREAFFQFLKALQGVQSTSATVEGLIAFHHSADCGLILTGKGAGKVVQQIAASQLLEVPTHEPPTDLLQQGLSLLQEGEYQGALSKFTAAYELNNYHREAYIFAAVLSEQLGQYADAELAAVMGSHYFPDEAVLRYFLAVSRLRQGNGEGAAEALEGVQTYPALSLFSRQILDGMILLSLGRMRQGRRTLLRARPRSGAQESALLSTQRWVRAQLAARSVLQGAAAVLTAVILWGALSWSWWLAPLSVVSIGLIPATHAAWRRQYQRLLALEPAHGLKLIEQSALQGMRSPQKRRL